MKMKDVLFYFFQVSLSHLIMKCWDLGNFQKHAKWSETTLISHLFAFNTVLKR